MNESLMADAAVLTEAATAGPGVGLAELLLHFRISQFLYHEAQLLDEHRFKDWLNLFADEVSYRVPVQRNRLRRQRALDPTVKPRLEMAHYDDDRALLEMRVAQLESGKNWAEEPRSRSRHFITNIRVEETTEPGLFKVRSNFIVTRNRGETEEDIWAGERYDTLRTHGTGFRITSRLAILDQNVVLSKNLSVFF
jgi:biphenyl 2,3-dioxygenase subunit beta